MKGNRLYAVRYRERNRPCKIKTFDTLMEARDFFHMAKGILDCVFVELMSVMEVWPPEEKYPPPLKAKKPPRKSPKRLTAQAKSV